VARRANFELFVRDRGGKPKLVTVLSDRPPKEDFPYTVIAHLPYAAQENGLPAGDELSRVNRLEDQIEEVLTLFRVVHLGHITSDGGMLVVFCAPEKVPSTITIKTGLLKQEKLTLDVRHDPEWNWFDSEMGPTAVEVELSRNWNLLQKLASYGDRSEAVRQVDFWAYFKSPEQRAAFLGAIAAEGYRQSSESNDGKPPYPYGLEFAIQSDTQAPTMAHRCAFLRAEATKADGDFDGWACHVVKA